MIGNMEMGLVIFLQALLLVNGWNGNMLGPKRDLGTAAGGIKDKFMTQNSVAGFGASYVLCNLILGNSKASYAATLLAEMAPSMLKQRATSMDSNAYQPGIKIKDVYYPSWFEGRWEACSVFDAVEAPLGEEVFGGKPVLTAAEKDLQSKLSYPVLFKTLMPDQIPAVVSTGINNSVISDRLYNVEQIALASMGPNSIIDDAQKDSDLARKLSLAVSPTASNGTVFDIDLIVTDREQSETSPNTFEALERTAQVITVRARAAIPPLPLRKEIETITSYTKVDASTIVAIQRTATFLSALDPRYRLAAARDARVSTTAVDIRRYTVTYKKVG